MLHLDAISEGATIIGAVNTIVRNGKILKGYNTNAIGFMDALNEAGFEVPGKTALVFGTGGAAKAVVFILNWLRARSILVAGRTEEKAQGIAHRIGGEVRPLESLLEQTVRTHIVVNATSVSSPEEAPELVALIASLQVPDCELVFDLNYGRSPNFWRDMARAKGIPFRDGLTALAHQARRTFALWTGVQVAASEFLKAIEET
jgi:shikimate dehydrogenase